MRILVLLAFMMCLPAFPVSSQTNEFLESHTALASAMPADLAVEMRLASTRRVFQTGEIIPVRILFSSSTSGRYGFNASTYDRGGRNHRDLFITDKPGDAVDPLLKFFAGNPDRFMQGGIFARLTLDRVPKIIDAELNEFIRFEKPGKYRIYAKSFRVEVGRGTSSEPIDTVSNFVEVTIAPPNELWQRRQLRRAIRELESSDSQSACRKLRFLDTPDSIRAIIKRFDGRFPKCEYDFAFGLVGSAHSELAVTEMVKALENPTFPVTTTFFGQLLLASFITKDREAEKPTQLSADDWQRIRKLNADRRSAERTRLVEMLANALKYKKGEAKVVSNATFNTLK